MGEVSCVPTRRSLALKRPEDVEEWTEDVDECSETAGDSRETKRLEIFASCFIKVSLANLISTFCSFNSSMSNALSSTALVVAFGAAWPEVARGSGSVESSLVLTPLNVYEGCLKNTSASRDVAVVRRRGLPSSRRTVTPL